MVDRSPADVNKIFFGAWVELEDEDSGEILRYRIVGEDEIDLPNGYISVPVYGTASIAQRCSIY